MTTDVIFTAIIGALAAEPAKKAAGDAYDSLKSLLRKTFGSDSDVDKAIVSIEAKPTSEGRKQTLGEELSIAHAEDHPEIVSAARRLLTLVSSASAGSPNQTAQGVGIAQADRGSSATVTMHSAKSND